MWFRRLRRRPQLDIAQLERLAETLRRTAALLEERLAACRSAPTVEPEGFVLFVPARAGYELVAADGPDPERGERLRVEEQWYRVLRLGPSPLPGDRRRCVFLEPHVATLN